MMKKILFSFACLSVVLGVVLMRTRQFSEGKSSVRSDVKVEQATKQIIQTSAFANEVTVDRVWREASVRPSSVCERALAGIVNHHILAADLLARFFSSTAKCRPDVTRVIILSPDHYQVARSPVATARVVYRGGEKILSVDDEGVNSLLRALPETEENAEIFAREHGIGALAPFVSRAWPQSQLVPLIVSSRLSRATGERLALWLADQMNAGAFVMVSSDMSHYLSEQLARQFDERTLTALDDNDEEYFWTARDDATDNGKALWVVLRALASPKWKTLNHSISTNYGGSPGYTTTYVTGWWEEGAPKLTRSSYARSL